MPSRGRSFLLPHPLLISPHTVHDHVKAVYAKLSVRSRVELIATLSYELSRSA